MPRFAEFEWNLEEEIISDFDFRGNHCNKFRGPVCPRADVVALRMFG